tara:strand:+ start:473 stop:694 length:222 start_codon:yes stop_codon:yes gene_type:complete
MFQLEFLFLQTRTFGDIRRRYNAFRTRRERANVSATSMTKDPARRQTADEPRYPQHRDRRRRPVTHQNNDRQR